MVQSNLHINGRAIKMFFIIDRVTKIVYHEMIFAWNIYIKFSESVAFWLQYLFWVLGSHDGVEFNPIPVWCSLKLPGNNSVFLSIPSLRREVSCVFGVEGFEKFMNTHTD